jgi:hypothetical protein
VLDDFAVLILTHGRPDNVKTFRTLRRHGYTGAVYIVIDDTDPRADEYRDEYGDLVVVFKKRGVWSQIDNRTNSRDMGGIVYARNAAFDVAESLGVGYFLQLDDDYTNFGHRVLPGGVYHKQVSVDNLDAVFEAMLTFFKSSTASSIAFGQGGDMIAGGESHMLSQAGRKCMNSFFCSTARRFTFDGLLNEDVNTYTLAASRGLLFLTVAQVILVQVNTQAASGGITDLYLRSGTYTKSFYTVLGSPSCVKIAAMGMVNPRLHHRVSWRNAVPQIIGEHHRLGSPEVSTDGPTPPVAEA